MGKVIRGETQIIIPNDTLVLLCGSQRSGKTTFARKHFDPKYVLNTDDVFDEVIEKGSVFDTMDTLAEKTANILDERINQSAKENPITVLDAVPFEYDRRMGTIRKMKGLYPNIILIVLDIKPPILRARPKRKIDAKKKKYGITHIGSEELVLNSLIISHQITDKSIGAGVNKAYVLSEDDIKKAVVIFE